MTDFEKRNDPFSVDTYDFTDFYFDFYDYEVFFPRNITDTSKNIYNQRKVVQEKLLAIHKLVEKQINQLNLFAHWDKNNITSLTFPCVYNNNMVDWMGVRYGKSKKEIILGGGVKDVYESFTKHACLQYNVSSDGFSVVLFFAVKTGAVDRSYLTDNLDKLAYEINQQAQNMKGYGLIWQITGCPGFNFDTDDDLAAYLRRYDREGRYSSMNMSFKPNEPRIKHIDDICKEIIKGFKLFKPLYDIVAWRQKN